MKLRIDIIGDSGPFSQHGLSISYRLRYGPAEYLVDCGAPIFEKAGWAGVGRIRGIVATHSHEDHRRWFTDIALFKKYLEGRGRKLRLITTEPIHDEFRKNSRGALERTLSPDSKQVVETPYEEFVEPVLVGPRARYRIMQRPAGRDGFAWRVVDAAGRPVPPGRAKVVVNHRDQANRPRLLFRDPSTGEWVEPESYYAFGDPAFYASDPMPYVDPETGLTLAPIKDSAWHGPTTIGVEVRAGRERLLFSSDTVYDPALWRELAEERRPQRLPLPRAAFEKARVVYGSINDLIERTWSRRRLEEALRTYDGAVVIHDVANPGSVVHTSYPNVPRDRAAFLLLTHAPDRFVSEFPLALSGKTFVLDGNRLDEEVEGRRCRLDADVYVKDFDVPKVGFRDPRGPFKVMERGGMLSLAPAGARAEGREVMRVRLHADVLGRYLPLLAKPNERYQVRADGNVERVTETARGSRGVVVPSLRRG
jgi:hypothetical protein